MCRWRDVIAGSSAPILPNRNLFSQNQHEIASTGKQIVMVGRPEVLCQSLPSFRYRLSFVHQKSLNVSEKNWKVYRSKVLIHLTPELICAIYSTSVPFSELGRRNYYGRKPGSRRSMQGLVCPAQCKTEPLKALDSRQKKPQYLRLQYPTVQRKKKWMEDSGKVECTGKQKLVR